MSLINYNNPLRQAAGVLTTYLSTSDNSFSISPSTSILTTGYFTIGYQDPYEGDDTGSDSYIPGQYVLDLQTMSSEGNFYYDTNGSSPYILPSWISGEIVVNVNSAPVIGETQNINSQVYSIIDNNFGLGNRTFYLALSEAIGTDESWGDEVYIEINVVQGITYQIDNYTKHFYHFNQRLEQASYLETDIYGENGSYGVSQKLEITLEGYDQNTKNIISVLNKNRLRGIIEDQSGNFYLIGYQNYLTSTTADGGLGKGFSDGIKTTISFEGKEPLKAISLDDSILYSGILIF